LHKAGAKVKFGGRPFEILSVLLERHGELVTREELQKLLWPDTFVDVDHNLNTAINKIREVLGDSSERPRFVETLPKRGYRFIGELHLPIHPVLPVIEPDRGSRSRRWFLIAGGVLTMLIISLAASVLHRSRLQQSVFEPASSTVFPFTALPGRAASPAFSPDGSRIAFVWNGDPKGPNKGFDLYVKALGSETLLRLTTHPSEWVSPVWSPDGTQIAFYRMDGADTGIYAVSALGGPERKIRSTHTIASDFATVSWSHDGRWIAFTDLPPSAEHVSIYLLSMEKLEAKQVPSNPECIREGLPAFSQTGEYLAYWCLRRPYDAVLYVMPTEGGRTKAVSTLRAFPTGLAWSADDKRLVYSVRSLESGITSELGQVDIVSGSTKEITFARSAWQPAVLPVGNKLAYSSLSRRSSLWRRDLVRSETSAVELIPSSRSQFDAQYSPDGGKIAFVSFRSGLQGVWISNADGTDLVQVSDPHYASGSPQWSPDGHKIAFDSHPGERWEIYKVDITERKPRQLLTSITNVIRPHWSNDGRWIYFSSMESGKMGIYRCPALGGDADLLSRGLEDVNARESLDGKAIYFASSHDKSTLKQIALPLQTKAESNLEGLPKIYLAELWTLYQSGIYFVPAATPRSLFYFDLTSKQARKIFEAEGDFGDGLSVSPDGRWIMYSLVGEENSDIMLIDHFQ
jgi:Tol biopolymer transport system component